MNIDMEQTSFTSMLENPQFGGALQVPQQLLMHTTQGPSAFGLQDMMSMGASQFMKQQSVHDEQDLPSALASMKLPANQSVRDIFI